MLLEYRTITQTYFRKELDTMTANKTFAASSMARTSAATAMMSRSTSMPAWAHTASMQSVMNIVLFLGAIFVASIIIMDRISLLSLVILQVLLNIHSQMRGTTP